jgi:hypothetical protein
MRPLAETKMKMKKSIGKRERREAIVIVFLIDRALF